MPKGQHNSHVRGRNHYRWNTGRLLSSDGYVKVRVGRKHPLADPNGYCYEHLLVYVAAVGEKPPANCVIHHINEDRTDNRLENLEVILASRHNSIHLPQRDPRTGRFIGKKAAGGLLDGEEWLQFPLKVTTPRRASGRT